MMMEKLIGNKKNFALQYSFHPKSHRTKLKIYVNGKNILSYKRGEKYFTTYWDLNELALWLKNFIDNVKEDPYPVKAEGRFAAEKDDNAREFDSENEEEFEAYYQKLYEWNLRHRWHSASNGAILANVYFELVDNFIEISWDNRDIETDVNFTNILGGAQVPSEDFTNLITIFLKDYAKQMLK